jgi:hypothetical protein
MTTQATPGDPGYCIYTDNSGNASIALSYLRSGGTVAFNAVASSGQPVSGLGDRAFWEPTSAALMVLKGGTVLSVTAGDGTESDQRRQELSKQIAAIGVTRQ